MNNKRTVESPTHREILLNHTEIRLYLPFSDWFGTANQSLPFAVPNQSLHGKYNQIWVWFNAIWKTFPLVHHIRSLRRKAKRSGEIKRLRIEYAQPYSIWQCRAFYSSNGYTFIARVRCKLIFIEKILMENEYIFISNINCYP